MNGTSGPAGRRGGLTYLQRRPPRPQNERPPGERLGPAGRGIFQSGFCLSHGISEEAETVHSKGAREKHPTSSRPRTRKGRAAGSQASPSSPRSLLCAARDGVVTAYISLQGWADVINFLFRQGKAFLEDTRKATIVTNGARQARDR